MLPNRKYSSTSFDKIPINLLISFVWNMLECMSLCVCVCLSSHVTITFFLGSLGDSFLFAIFQLHLKPHITNVNYVRDTKHMSINVVEKWTKTGKISVEIALCIFSYDPPHFPLFLSLSLVFVLISYLLISFLFAFCIPHLYLWLCAGIHTLT